MKIILSILLAFISFTSFSQTQGQMNDAARAEYEKADKQLNRVYQKIISDNKSDTLFIKNLGRAQRAWVAFRDAQMDMKYPDNGEPQGSSFPMCWSIYLTELTNTRTKELKVWINGIEEGDICIGSVPFKKQ